MIVDVLRLFERWRLENVAVRPGKNGDEAWACCPLHGETSPSFSVNMQTGKWHCFSCHARGSSIETLVAQMEKLTTEGEIKAFLRMAASKDVDEIRADLRAKRREQRLAAAQRGRPDRTETDEWRRYARNEHPYLRRRGFDNAIIGVHRIGYDPRQRAITIPVFEHGICRFMYRRFVDPTAKGAYRYPSEIDKSSYLWGLERPEEEYRGKTLYVNEGALDSLWLRQHRYDYSTAILGSFMSECQARKLVALEPSEIVLFFDNDTAGYDATEHAGNLLLRLGMRNVYYLRYRRAEAGDPQTCSAKEIARMVARRKHFNHFRLASKVGRRRRIRNLLAIANNSPDQE